MSLYPQLSAFDVSLPLIPWRTANALSHDRILPMLDDDTPKITYSESDTKARYGAIVPGIAGEAELTISKVSPALIIADHTFVPEELRGRGLAAALAARLIEDARDKGQRIVPLCPFLRAYADKHREELSDVIQW